MSFNDLTLAIKGPPFVPDELDLLILERMADDAEIQFKKLADSLKVDQRTIAKHVNKMKENGVFKNKIEINWSRIGLGIAAYVGAETGLGEKDLAKLHEFIRKEPRVVEAFTTIGGQEYLFKILDTDLQSLREDVLMPFEPITAKLTSAIISSQIKQQDNAALLRFLRQKGFSRKKRKVV